MYDLLHPKRVAPLLTFIIRIWSRTFRYKQVGFEQIAAIRKKRPMVFTLWHDEIFSPCYFHRDEGIIAIVSASRDGEYISQVLARLGYNLSRGSSTRGGLQALRKAYRKMQELNQDVVFTLDGPKGPRHEAKEGAVYLAHKADALLVPMRVKINRVKRFNKSWDKFQLPMPGSECVIYYGQPYAVEYKKISPEIIKKERQKLQEKMDQLGFLSEH